MILGLFGFEIIVKLQVFDLGLGDDFTFAWDNKNNDNHNNHNNNPHLTYVKGTVVGDITQGIRDKG